MGRDSDFQVAAAGGQWIMTSVFGIRTRRRAVHKDC